VTWGYTESMTLTASSVTFTAADIGNAIVLTVGAASVACSIIGYTSTTVVTVRPDVDVPAAFRAVALTTWARAVDEVSGLSHLEGRTVSILADGNVEPQQVVVGGKVTLTRPYVVIHAGLPFTSDLESLDLENVNGETLSDKRKRINRVSLLVESSRGIFAGQSLDDTTLREFKQRTNEGYGDPVSLLTGQAEILIDSSWNTGARWAVRQKDPLPITVLSATPAFQVGG
jgi:hypothetical protein